MRLGAIILLASLAACSQDDSGSAPSGPVDAISTNDQSPAPASVDAISTDDQSPAPGSGGAKPIVGSSIELPASEVREKLLGDWESDGFLMYRVRRDSNGAVVLEQMTSEAATLEWRFESRNPRWLEGRLVIDQFAHAINFPSHPFSGQRMAVYFQPTDDANVLLHGVVSVEFADELPDELAESMELHRVSPE